MVDLRRLDPIIAALRPNGLIGILFHFFNDLNARETASWHAFQV
ncbi:MAG: hypothetical protein CFH41_02345 [Alphaproteobacteria bacterium MarineAlpha11_Bin1]|nr:MAG: hypothetical protein CFH41_02345 [Alphaproteobacteria bacterium MarineAlpha11_Bin1]